jgi:hypothetical protein
MSSLSLVGRSSPKLRANTYFLIQSKIMWHIFFVGWISCPSVPTYKGLLGQDARPTFCRQACVLYNFAKIDAYALSGIGELRPTNNFIRYHLHVGFVSNLFHQILTPNRHRANCISGYSSIMELFVYFLANSIESIYIIIELGLLYGKHTTRL